MNTSDRPSELIARLGADDAPAFALLHRWNPQTGRSGPVELLTGTVSTVERLADIPLPSGPVQDARHDALALVPFRQIRERGFHCHDDQTPLQVLRVEDSHRFPRDELAAILPNRPVTLRDAGFDLDDEEYGAIVKRIVHDEIATGAGANFVIRRNFTAQLDDYGPAVALSLFRQLLGAERGAYWTFLVYTGTGADGTPGRTLVGASPEVHVRMGGGEVVMNPISGTYRYPDTGPDLDGLLRFLQDPKEIAELSMVLDEELKMMCTVGDHGGEVHGPYLRAMAHLAHTEFELRGRSSLDARDVLRETMFAATVTGSPLENACRVIQRYEPSGRRYYAGALALFGRDPSGAQRLDSPIFIRAADIAPDGGVRVPVGATLVRDSNPSDEVAETWAKVAGVLTALGARAVDASVARRRAESSDHRTGIQDDPRVSQLLNARRADLAPFWLRAHSPAAPRQSRGRVAIIDTGDSFTAMLAHLLDSSGLRPVVHRYDEPDLHTHLDGELTVLGPGPGDPNDTTDRRITELRSIAEELARRAQNGAPVLGVCLGHELLAQSLGLRIERLATPNQGAQRTIELFGRRTTVGFYNSFAAYAGDAKAGELATCGIELSRDTDTGEVFALRGPAIAGVQCHLESVLTLDGPSVVREVLETLLPSGTRRQ
jgi:phenazine biosynthesis protein phzE